MRGVTKNKNQQGWWGNIFFVFSCFFLFTLGESARGISQMEVSREFRLGVGGRILIVGYEAQVNLSGDLQGGKADLQVGGVPSSSIRVVLDSAGESNLDVSLMKGGLGGGDLLQIREKEELLKKKSPRKLKVSVFGRPVPVEVHLLGGEVSLSKWSKDAYIHLQKGNLYDRDGRGILMAHLVKGDLTVVGREGKLVVDNVHAGIFVKRHKGNLDIQNFIGNITLENVDGSTTLLSHQGELKIRGGRGGLQFETQKSSLSIARYEGRVEGLTQEGSVVIESGREPDVSVRTISGRVSVSTASSSGALLNLSTSEGEIIVPSYLRVNKGGGQRSLRGRLRGELQKGVIQVRSQEGTILVK